MKKINKGQWGYINYQKKRVLLITLILYLCSIGIYLFGLYTYNTYKNIWSVVAVLSILPASKSMVNLIMFFRFKSIDKADFDLYVNSVKKGLIIHELALTTYERTYFVDSIYCYDNTIIGLYVNNKKVDYNKLNKEITQHIKSVLKNDNVADCTIKIFNSKESYINRIIEIENNLNTSNKKNDERIVATLKAVSL